jgi:hypothetical protein
VAIKGECDVVAPRMRDYGNGHQVACHVVEKELKGTPVTS